MGKTVSKTIQFGSLDNQHDPKQVGADNLVIAANVDIMDDKSVQIRTGFSQAYNAGSPHSFWSSNDRSVSYYVEGNTLTQFFGNGVTPKVALPDSKKVSFVEINNIIAIASNTDLSFFDGTNLVTFSVVPTTDGETQFKSLTSGWNGICCLAYFNGHLLAGTANGVLVSDQYNVGQYDRRDFLLPTDFSVEQIAVVEDGFWLCGTEKAVFLSGEAIGKLVWHEIIDVGIQSIAPIRRDEIKGNESAKPEFIVMADTGVFILGDSGSMKSLTDDTYRPPKTGSVDFPCKIRPGIVRTINGSKQFLTTREIIGNAQKMYVNKAGLYPVTSGGLNVSGTGSQASVNSVAVNIKNGAVSEYTNFDFHSFIELNDVVYGLQSDYIYSLTGSDDNGTEIDSTFLTGITDFPDEGQYGAADDDMKQKALTDLYLGMRVFDEAGSAWLIIEQTIPRFYPYLGTSFTDLGIRNIRIKIPKGLKGRYWQFGYQNTDGSAFEIESIYARGARLKRRV